MITFLIAVGLAMDAFAVSIGLGVKNVSYKVKYALRVALFFGAFQAVMPFIGWLLGEQFAPLISNYDHWVAFSLLAAVSFKMIYEGVKGGSVTSDGDKKVSLHTLLLLSLATSIDALAVGVSFAFLGVKILIPCIVIGGVTFVISFVGVDIGKRLGSRFKNGAEILGGVILLAIAVKILFQHILF
ncbi:MAG: manganese efflux pump MntP family protein [Pseudomonadota bacterium]